MDGGYYLKRLTDLNQQLFVIIGELAQDEYAKEQLFHIVKPGEKIIQFPTKKTKMKKKVQSGQILILPKRKYLVCPKNLENHSKQVTQKHI